MDCDQRCEYDYRCLPECSSTPFENERVCEKCGEKTHGKFIGKWLCVKHGRELIQERKDKGITGK